jgi:hypothetical protein
LTVIFVLLKNAYYRRDTTQVASVTITADSSGDLGSAIASGTAVNITGSSIRDIIDISYMSAANTVSTGGGTDSIVTGAGADTITGGEDADTITGGAGNDTINLTETTAAVDKVVFSGGTAIASAAAPTAHLTANGADVITGFGSTDTINIVALTGAVATISTNNTITSASTQGAATTDQTYIISTTGAAANLTTSGTAVVTDWTNLTQVAAYLSERLTVTSTAQYNNFIINNTSGNNDTSYE